MKRYGLTLHPEKTRLVDMRRPSRRSPVEGKEHENRRSFDLLGFTHHWGRSYRAGWAIKRRTAKDRFSRALRKLAQWCREVRHWSIAEQHEQIVRKLRGHYAYYGVTSNGDALVRLHTFAAETGGSG